MVFNPRRMPFEIEGGRLTHVLNAAMKKRILKQGMKKICGSGWQSAGQ